MSAISDGWQGTNAGDRQRIDLSEDSVPQGKKWECCPHCQGRGKVLVDEVNIASLNVSMPLNSPLYEGSKSPATEEKKRGNNPFGPRGTLRCLACQKRKKRCEFESVDTACLRCQMRSLECGPKLPPQQRPRSITSVPADYQRPVSLNIDTRLLSSITDGFDTPLSAGSLSSALQSLPVSPFILPTSHAQLELPSSFSLDHLEQNTTGYRSLGSSSCRMNYALSPVESHSLQHGLMIQTAPEMSQQTSQQTVKQEMIFESPTLNFLPPFSIPEEGSQNMDMNHPNSYHSTYLIPNRPTTVVDFQNHEVLNTPHAGSAPQQWEVYSTTQEVYPTSHPSISPTHNLPSSSLSQPPPHCAECGTVQSRAWRKTQFGNVVCEACGLDTHLTNLRQPVIKQRVNGPGGTYWREKFVRNEAPSFNSFLSDDTNGTMGSQEQHNTSQESEDMLFEMQI